MDGSADFHPSIEKWTEDNFSIVKYGIRSRGKGRGLGVRLEPYLKKREGFVNEKTMVGEPNIQGITSIPLARASKEYSKEIVISEIETIFENFNKKVGFLQALELLGYQPVLEEDIKL